MTEEEKKVLFEILKSIQGNHDRLLSENEEDKNDLQAKYQDLYIAIGNLTSEVHLLVEESKKLTSTFQKGKSDLVEEVKHVAEVVDTSPVHIVKRDLSFKDLIAKLKIWDHHQDILPKKS